MLLSLNLENPLTGKYARNFIREVLGGKPVEDIEDEEFLEVDKQLVSEAFIKDNFCALAKVVVLDALEKNISLKKDFIYTIKGLDDFLAVVSMNKDECGIIFFKDKTEDTIVNVGEFRKEVKKSSEMLTLSSKMRNFLQTNYSYRDWGYLRSVYNNDTLFISLEEKVDILSKNIYGERKLWMTDNQFFEYLVSVTKLDNYDLVERYAKELFTNKHLSWFNINCLEHKYHRAFTANFEIASYQKISLIQSLICKGNGYIVEDTDMLDAPSEDPMYVMGVSRSHSNLELRILNLYLRYASKERRQWLKDYFQQQVENIFE